MTTKDLIIEYRNSHPESRIILGVVLAEFERDSKLNKEGNQKNPSDDDCIRIIKKLIESNIECREFEENKILERFIPQQLNEEVIFDLIKTNNFKNIGDCMKFFKDNYTGLYDGKVVNKLFKNNN